MGFPLAMLGQGYLGWGLLTRFCSKHTLDNAITFRVRECADQPNAAACIAPASGIEEPGEWIGRTGISTSFLLEAAMSIHGCLCFISSLGQKGMHRRFTYG